MLFGFLIFAWFLCRKLTLCNLVYFNTDWHISLQADTNMSVKRSALCQVGFLSTDNYNYLSFINTSHLSTFLIYQHFSFIKKSHLSILLIYQHSSFINSSHWSTIIVHQHFSLIKKTRPLSDSETATMYKLKGKSSNLRTGQGFK